MSGGGSGLNQFRRSYEISPIILNGGIATNVPGGMIPIISLIQPQDFSGGLLSSGDDDSDSNFVAHFSPMAGGTLIENQVGQYPFANQQVAANAIIAQPLRLSLLMVAPAPTNGGYSSKLQAITSLQQTLENHHPPGGGFTVATPAFIYPNMLLLSVKDVTAGDTLQVQTRWQWEFFKPLITAAEAQAAQNSLMSKVSAGVQVTGNPPSPSGTQVSVGDPSSGVGPPLVPAAQNTAGSSATTGQFRNNTPNPPSGSSGIIPQGPN